MRTIAKILLQCLAILAVGVAGYAGLAILKKPPETAPVREPPIRVAVVAVEREQVQVHITGYGTVRSLNVVSVMPEVSGTVVALHPRLEVGEVIPRGETLFVIDPSTYQAQVHEARATVAQLESGLNMLRIQQRTDAARLDNIERTRDLAKADFERMKDLFEADRVGAKAGVEIAEQAYNKAQDEVARMQQALALYPEQIKEAESRLAAARAKLEQAEANLARARVTAPFEARIKSKQVDQGQYVAPGATALVLADDSMLEVSVPLDSDEARQWLRFKERTENGTAWFGAVEPVECTIRWTEDEQRAWPGTLDRVEAFDARTRTLTVAVRITAEEAQPQGEGRLPLVDGMFCEVEIPGQAISEVFRVPRSAVTFDGTIYVARDRRLRTVPIELVHEQEESAFVRGLRPGDQVITTRLINPAEGAPLEVLGDA